MRIRNMKPEFWRSEDIKRLSREDRLLFVGLWSYVDDNGVGIDDYRQIAADLFPIEDDPIEVREFVREGLQRISRGSLLTRYEVSGKAYVFVNGWAKHQKVYNPNKPRFPLPNGIAQHPASDYVVSPEDVRRLSEDSTEGLNLGENGHAPNRGQSSPEPSTSYPQGSTGEPSTSGSVDPPETLGTGTEVQGVRGTGGQEEKNTSAEPPRADVEALCLRLRDRVVANGAKSPTITAKWRDEARRLLDRDERPLDVALRLIDWATSHEFWQANVLSMPKFREKYDQLLLQARREQQQRAPDARPSTTDQRVAQAQSLKALYAEQTSNVVQLPGAAS